MCIKLSTENLFGAYQQQQWKRAGKNQQKLYESGTAGSVLCKERCQKGREGHGFHTLFNAQHESLNQASVDGKRGEEEAGDETEKGFLTLFSSLTLQTTMHS